MRNTLLSLVVAAMAAVVLALLPAPAPLGISAPPTTTWTAGIETHPLPSATPLRWDVPVDEGHARVQLVLPSSTELQGIEHPTEVLALMMQPAGTASVDSGGLLDVAPADPAQTGPKDETEAADPFKVYDVPAGSIADDPHKVYDTPAERNYDPFKVYDDPLAPSPPDTANQGKQDYGSMSNSQLEPHHAGAIVSDTDLGSTMFEPHVDGKRPVPAGLSPTEANTVPQADLTNTVLANHVGLTAPTELDTETLAEPAKPWLGSGTDTSVK